MEMTFVVRVSLVMRRDLVNCIVVSGWLILWGSVIFEIFVEGVEEMGDVEGEGDV